MLSVLDIHVTVYSILSTVPSDSPSILQSVTINSSTVLVTLLPPPPEHQNGIITTYIVNVSLEGSHTEYQLTTTSLNLTLEGLHPFSTYIMVVAAETEIGRGPFSSPFEIHTPEDGKFVINCLVNTSTPFVFEG